jgi:hypothetical protein
MIMAPKKTTRVSPSARGEGSKAKPVAKKVSPSKRGEGSTNAKATVAMKKKTAKVKEAGVGNLPMAAAKLAMAIAKRVSSSGSAPKPLPAKTIKEAEEFQKLMAQQSARSATAKSRQDAKRKTQLAKEAKESKTSTSRQALTDRQKAEADRYTRRSQPVGKRTSTN